MNRCQRLLKIPRSSIASIAAAALCLPLAASLPTPLRAQTRMQVQTDPALQTQNEAALGGRNFPVGTLRGALLVIDAPVIRLDGQADRLSPGARIRDARNMLVMPASVIGQNLLVNYTRDASGLVHEIWVLTPDEARAERASVARPLLGFWPFTAASAAPRDDGATPFNQLPKYGE